MEMFGRPPRQIGCSALDESDCTENNHQNTINKQGGQDETSDFRSGQQLILRQLQYLICSVWAHKNASSRRFEDNLTTFPSTPGPGF